MMSTEQNSPVGNNEFVRIGILLLDMHKNLPLEINRREIDFIEAECERIAQYFTWVWHDRMIGQEYYLDFHMQEAKRLKESITVEDLMVPNGKEPEDIAAFRMELYALLRENLSELVLLMDTMINGEGIAIS